MLSRRFYRHLQLATDAELAAEVRLTLDHEELVILIDTLRQRLDAEEAIEQALPGHRWDEIHPQHVDHADDTPTGELR